jgi:Fe-S cluster assembly protein SufD
MSALRSPEATKTSPAGAVETAPVSSLHSRGSADPDSFPVPGGREEEWRFTPLRRLRKLHADAVLNPMGVGTAGVELRVEAAPEIYVERSRLSRDTAQFLPTDRVSARAFAAAGQATVVTVPKDTTASAPTYLRVTGTGPAVESSTGAVAAHLIIDVQPYGRATVVIDQRGSATLANNVEIHVGDGGDLTLVALADWADDTVQVSHHQITIGRDAHLAHFAVTLGGSVVRLSPSVRYTGPGGDVELHGIAFADAGQHLEHRLFVDHGEPNCRSRVGYKGALSGEGATTIWIGDVLIRTEATGTDTYEYNRNLVLTDGAHAESVPNLEILTGEVAGAGHASASGRLEDEHLFYLQSRGIPLEEARRLVIRGFFGELIAKIGLPELEERITSAIEEELS